MHAHDYNNDATDNNKDNNGNATFLDNKDIRVINEEHYDNNNSNSESDDEDDDGCDWLESGLLGGECMFKMTYKCFLPVTEAECLRLVP